MNNGYNTDFWQVSPFEAYCSVFSTISQVLDIVGINYHVPNYDSLHKQYDRPLIGSETSSALTDRGIYATNSTAAYVTAYDLT